MPIFWQSFFIKKLFKKLILLDLVDVAEESLKYIFCVAQLKKRVRKNQSENFLTKKFRNLWLVQLAELQSLRLLAELQFYLNQRQ
jgi:hypothetical protein